MDNKNNEAVDGVVASEEISLEEQQAVLEKFDQESEEFLRRKNQCGKCWHRHLPYWNAGAECGCRAGKLASSRGCEAD